MSLCLPTSSTLFSLFKTPIQSQNPSTPPPPPLRHHLLRRPPLIRHHLRRRPPLLRHHLHLRHHLLHRSHHTSVGAPTSISISSSVHLPGFRWRFCLIGDGDLRR
ncbi:hypothetical protein HanPI659440_Chr03g0110821 [Helianthus annuus]|nr:hypothetical protein HanPI659440_Chr03g0110821 [Helianthus annuus]